MAGETAGASGEGREEGMRLGQVWRIGGGALALGFLTLFVGGGGRHAIGLVLKPMAEALAWDRTLLGAVIAVFMGMTAVTMTVVGRLADRYPVGWILAGGFLVSAFGVGLMGFVETAWQAFLLYGVVFAVGNGAVSITPVGVMLTRRFGGQAGVANSIAISGMGLGQLVILAGLSAVLVDVGWRAVFFWLGAINLVAAPALLLAVREERRSRAAVADRPTDGLDAREAARRRAFWALMAAYAICGFQDFFVSAHVVAFALDRGVGQLFAGNLLAFMGLAGLAGVIVAGALADRLGPGWPTAACFVLRVLIFGLIAAAKDPLTIAVFALGYGFTYWATAPLTVLFVRDHFGPRNLGMISGMVTMTHHIAGGLGALAGAVLFDREGDYQSAFLLMTALSLVGVACTLAIGRRSRSSPPLAEPPKAG